MLRVNMSSNVGIPIGFKGQERKLAVKIGKNLMDADTYVNNVNQAIFNKSTKSYGDFVSIIKTCNFAQAQCNLFQSEQYKAEQNLYKKLIQRCIDDIDQAIAKNEPEEKVDKFVSILELFVKKFGHYDK